MTTDYPPVPDSLDDLPDAIRALIAGVDDPDVAYGPNTDGYGKCVEAMWRAAYITHELVAKELGVTGFQHGMSALMLVGALRAIEGPYMLLGASNALFPQYDVLGDAREFLERDTTRAWLVEQARTHLAKYEADPMHEWTDDDGVTHQSPTAHPDVVAHWRHLAQHTPAAGS